MLALLRYFLIEAYSSFWRTLLYCYTILTAASCSASGLRMVFWGLMLYIYIYMYKYVYIYIYVYICIYICIYIYVCVCVCVCVYVCLYIYIYIFCSVIPVFSYNCVNNAIQTIQKHFIGLL